MPEVTNHSLVGLMRRPEDAPVQSGIPSSGPWLAITDDREYWLIEWTGAEFLTLQGAKCQPIALVLLPPIPDVLRQILS